MKEIKPGRIEESLVEEVSDKEYECEPKATRIENQAWIEEVEREENRRLTTLKGMSDFAKKSTVVVGLLAGVVFIGALYDAFFTTSSMLQNAPVLGIVYFVMLVSLIGLLGFGIVNQIRSYLKIQRIDNLQQEAKEIIAQHGRGARTFAQQIIAVYKQHPDPEIAAEVADFAKELPSLMDSEILPRMEEKLFASMDNKAKDIIAKYANQTALSTAISPVAVIDAVLILSRSHVMIKEIAEVYHLRPNVAAEFALIKKVFVNLAFAGVSDIMLHHSHDILGASVLSKISAHGAQGVANGILTARVGLSALQACRPLPLSKKQNGFFKNIFKMITNSLFGTKK